MVKVIHINNSKRRVKCPYCKKYTRNVHDKLKPIIVKYLPISGYTAYLRVYKRRFNCNNCAESTEESTKTVSTTNVSEDAISNYAKKGNGYAKITYIGETNDLN